MVCAQPSATIRNRLYGVVAVARAESLPEVAVGAEIRLDTRGQTFVYTVTSTQITGLYPGDDLMYGTDPSASVILLQTCIDSSRRLLVRGTLTATR